MKTPEEIADEIVVAWYDAAEIQEGYIPDYDLKPLAWGIAKAIRDERQAKPIKDGARLLDLVRYMRGELHQQDLLTDEEYEELLKVNGSPRRLEEYDALRARVKALEEGLRQLLISLRQLLISHRMFTFASGNECDNPDEVRARALLAADTKEGTP